MTARPQVAPSSSGGARPGASALPTWASAGAAFGLFLVWSNSFVAIGYLLGSEGAPARFDWLGLTAGRFLPAAAVAGGFRLVGEAVWERVCKLL